MKYMSGLFSKIPNDSFEETVITRAVCTQSGRRDITGILKTGQKKCRNRGTVSAISGKGLRR
jgi:hypothetical protein